MQLRKAVQLLKILPLLALFCLTPIWASAPYWSTRPGTIGNALTLEDNSHVYLDAVVVDKIKAKQCPDYFTIHECFSARYKIIVLTKPSPELRLNMNVDIEGDLTTLPNGHRALINARVYGYTDKDGRLLRHGPLIKGLLEPTHWQWKVDLTTESKEVPTPILPSSSEPNTTPARGPVFHPKISDALGRARLLADGDFIDLAEFQCKPILSTGVDQTYGNYFIMGEDSGPETLKTYYQTPVNTTDRVNKVSGQLREEDGGQVLCVDSGPGYDPQVFEGGLQTTSPPRIAYARTYGDGTTGLSIAGVIVSANQQDFPDTLYVQETNRSGGIRVHYTGATITRGSIVDVTGTIGLAADGERVIDAGSTGVTFVEQGTAPAPLGLPNKALGGSAFNIYTPGADYPASLGLYNKSLLVKSWGTVTAVDVTNRFFYIDDGTGFQDGSGNTGIKVSWAWSPSGKPTITPPQVGWHASVVGLSSSEAVIIDQEEVLVRVLRPRDQNDIVTNHDNTTPQVSITTPQGNDLHLAPSVTSVVLAGYATDTGSGVSSVVVGFTSLGQTDPPTNWEGNATYNHETGYWTYTWNSPQTKRVWVRATDGSGNSADTWKDLTVTTVSVVFADASKLDDSGNGLSWQAAKKTLNAALETATTGMEVWVAGGDYPVPLDDPYRFEVSNGVAVYGGFVGSETAREERNWTSHPTSLVGNSSYEVVYIADNAGTSTIVDGFTIRGGSTGITCGWASSAKILHNVIRNNTSTGIECFSASPRIMSNVIKSNCTSYGGTGINCQYDGTPQIINNTIIGHKGNNAGFGIYLYFGEGDAVVVNNILFDNNYGLEADWPDLDDIHHNCAYGNSQSNFYPTDLLDPQKHNIVANPMLFGSHLQRNSPCVDAGNNSVVADTDTDIDNQARTLPGYGSQTATADIGADESTGCEWYTISLTTSVGAASVGSEVPVDAVVVGADGNPISQYSVSFAVTNGSLVSPVSGEAFTNGLGKATAIVRRDNTGTLTLTATIDQPNLGEPEATASININFKSIVYVSQNGLDTNTGRDSWSNAVRTLAQGLSLATSGEEVWVDEGCFFGSSLALKAGVGMFGSFTGSKTYRSSRSADKTIICGTDPGYPVVWVASTAASTTVVDGFTICGGNSGISCASSAGPTITNNCLIGNYYGIGCGNATISNNLIKCNASSGISGAWDSHPRIANNTIVKNGGSGISSAYSYYISNNIIAFNGSGLSSCTNLNKNCVYSNPVPAPDPGNKDYISTTVGTGDISADPLLASDYIHINPNSPCVDAGSNQVSSIQSVDWDLQPRILKLAASEATIDIGADESDGLPFDVVSRVIRVTTQGNDANDGSAWDLAHAMKSIQAAVAKLAQTGGEVWVAAGNYDEHIVLLSNVKLYGGFEGVSEETDLSHRNWQTHIATINGQHQANCSVIVALGASNCVIDGFEIRGGRGRGSGGGIMCKNCTSISIANNTITDNICNGTYTASGGAIYCYASSVTIRSNRIMGNESSASSGVSDANYGGGGIYCGSSSASILSNEISGNISSGAYAMGGAIHCYNSSLALSNNWITDNTGYFSVAVQETPSIISNNTVVSNPAGGFRFTGNASSVSNNIICFNTGYNGLNKDTDASVVLKNNCVHQNGTDYSGTFDHASPDIVDDPELAEDNLHLKNTSPCIDAGEDDDAGGDYDIDGDPRKIAFTTTRDAVDIGADELDKLSPAITSARSVDCTTAYAVWRQYRGDVQNYYYAIGTLPTTTDVRGWTDAGGPASVDITATGLSLNHSGTYYFLLKVMQTNEQWSEVDSKQIDIGPNTLTLSANPTTAAAGSPVQITATVRDHFNNPLDMVVHFSADSGTIDTPDASTGSDGVVDVQVQNACQGTVTVSAYIEDTCGNRVDASIPFTIVANVLTLSAPADTAANSTVAVTATVKDQANNPLQRLVHFATDSGILDSEEATTGTDGTVTVHVSDACAGTATVTAYVEDACGNQTASTASFEVHADVLTLTCPQSNIAAGVPATITATATNYTGVHVDRQIHFWATGGTLDTTDGATGSDGQITTNLTCTTGGPVVVYASMDNSYPCGGRITKAVLITVIADTQITLTAAPGTGGHANQIAVTATVKDVAGNLVDRTVNFSVSSGTIDSTVQSGSDGIAEAYASYPSECVQSVFAWVDDAGGNRKNTAITFDARNSLSLPTGLRAQSPGGTLMVGTTVKDFNGNPISGKDVHFSVTAGSISPQVAYTDTSGVASTTLTCPQSGDTTIVAYIQDPCIGYVSASTSVPVASNTHLAGFLYYLWDQNVMYGGVVDVDSYFESVDTCYSDVAYTRIDSTLSDLSSCDTVFVVMPSRTFTTEELSALANFGNTPGKRIVLVGDWSGSGPWEYGARVYNDRLNGLLTELGVQMRFNTGQSDDNYGCYPQTCPVNTRSPIMKGVSGLWYGRTAELGTSGTTPLAYGAGTLPGPWIAEEKTTAGGSIVCIHDSNIFGVNYSYIGGDYIYYLEPVSELDKNLRFFGNLCFAAGGGNISGPKCFVPGHPNKINYRLESTYAYGKLEIFARNSTGLPTGSPVYTSTSLDLTTGDHAFTYSGTEINCDPGKYIARLTYGPDADNTQTSEMQFDVKCWDMVWLFEDSLTDEEKATIDQAQLDVPDDYVEDEDPMAPGGSTELGPYCAGIDTGTVTSSKVTVKVWYWNEEETGATTLSINNGISTTDITNEDWLNTWGQDLGQKPYYDERGSAITSLNGTFYSMTDPDQYFYVKITVSEDGVLDNAGNPYDANPDTPEIESTIKYKLKINSDGIISVLEETYE